MRKSTSSNLLPELSRFRENGRFHGTSNHDYITKPLPEVSWKQGYCRLFFVKYRVNNVIKEYTAHRVASSPDAVQFQLNGLPVPNWNGSSGKFVDWTGFHSWFCAVLQFTFYYEQSLLWCSFLSWSYLTSFCWISMHFVSWTRYLPCFHKPQDLSNPSLYLTPVILFWE